MSERCCKRVYAGSYVGHNCTKPAVVENEGKWYCKIHDPAYVEARYKKQFTKWDAESKQRQAIWARDKHDKALIVALLTCATREINNLVFTWHAERLVLDQNIKDYAKT